MKHFAMVLIVLLLVQQASAKIDLVTLPTRDMVQLTIYNSADLTLVRERRGLTLREGANRLQFSWANTLIDPTSLAMTPLANADKIDVSALVFPPRVKNLGLWTVDSEAAGRNPMEITYLTSGLSWRAFYMGTLSADESMMRLQGYVRVTNNSGEDYENAQTRLIVGKVNLIEQIAQLAKRGEPYGRPGVLAISGVAALNYSRFDAKKWDTVQNRPVAEGMAGKVKEVKKEGLSEYFLYTISGTETIPTGWSKRLPSFDVTDVPVLNLYKYDEAQFGPAVMRYLSFKNDEDHQLGETPIPGGQMKVYRSVDEQQHLSYEGASSFKYIPVKEEVELSLGAARHVSVVPTLMDVKTQAYEFNAPKGNISGWDEVQGWRMVVKNTRNVHVKIQIDRHLGAKVWTLENAGEFGAYEKLDLDTVRYTLELPARAERTFNYLLTRPHGTRIK